MQPPYIVHIVAGSLGLAFGYAALFTAKGSRPHRRSGMVFVYAMLTMCCFGAVMAATSGIWVPVNVPAGVITGYLVVTGLTAVRPNLVGRWLERVLTLVALGVGLMCLTFGFQAVAAGGMRDGIPAFPFFLFGIVGTLGGLGDVRVMRSGAPKGAPRLARHLWRMSFALFIAAMSFFIGQADVFPAGLRHPGVIAPPVLAVLVTMLYWLWRVRVRRSLRGIATAAVPEPA